MDEIFGIPAPLLFGQLLLGLINGAFYAMLSLGRMKEGEYVTIVAGSPPGTPGSTNALRVWRLGDPLPTPPG